MPRINSLMQKFRQDKKIALMENIREADERTQIMFNATPLGCKLWDRNLNIIECNAEALKLFDLPDKQSFFDRFFELSPECQPCGRTSKEMASELIEKAFEEGYQRFDWMHKKLDGELMPTEITLVRVKHKGDHVVAGYIRDLREYKQMMKKIEQRDNLLNTVNHAAVVLLATEGEDNLKSSIQEVMELMGRCVEVDRVQIWQNEISEGELCFVHKYEWLSELGKKKAPVPDGLKFPYDDMPEWRNKFLRGQYINGPLSEMTQKDRDFLGPFEIKSIVIIPLFLRDRYWGFFSLDDCHKERAFSEDEISILRSGGLLIANAFLRTDMMQNIRNASIQLEAALKEAQNANTAKSKFLAVISHEIRTPMNVILGITESQLLTEVQTTETQAQKAKEAFENIFNSGNMLLQIINDILDLSKIEAGKFELYPVNYESLNLIDDLANMNLIKFGHTQINFNFSVSENFPLHLFGDELRIKQVLNNLLSNAFKYTNEGDITLSFGAEKTTENTTTMIICVSDTGQGMTPEQVNKLFEEYTRFNMDANRTTVGTGLGMAITGNLVKLMKGMMCVDSTPGKGTSFIIHIPQKVTAPGCTDSIMAGNIRDFRSSGTARKTKEKITREPMPYGKVLIVDDMKSNLDVATLLLTPYELQIETAGSGEEAIEKIKNGNEYDIVFMDHMMPNMDGIETTKKIRELQYKHPVLALTANALAGQEEFFLKNGFDGYISKPISIRQLDDSLKKFVRIKDHRHSTQPESPGIQTEASNKNVAIQIPGVDTEKGLALYGDDVEVYISVLRSYVSNVSTVIEKLRNVSKETLSDYAIIVHGLKGISAGIGAEKIRETAANLEMLSKAGDLEGVLKINEAFVKDTENLASCVKAWLAEFDSSRPKPRLACPDRLLLAHLKKYCEAYDMRGIDNIMEELEKSSYDTDESLVAWLRERINESSFQAVTARLSEYGVEPNGR